MKKKILIIGPLLPPMGGVSVHIDRLAQVMQKDFEVCFLDESATIKNEIPNLRRITLLRYTRHIRNADVVHIHSGIRLFMYLHVLAARLLMKQTVLTIHSYRETSPLFKFFDRWIYSLPDTTIVVNKTIHTTLQLKNKVVVKDAFLPPVLEKEAPVPPHITDWILKKREDGYRIAVANAFCLCLHNNLDLYGMDLCIEAAAILRDANRKVAFVFAISHPNGDIDIREYEQQIIRIGLEDIFFVQQSPISFVNLIRESDVVLRPTNTDGDALTVRESLYLGKPVIASDAVRRPPLTRLFSNRCAVSLAKAIVDVTQESTGTNANETRVAQHEFHSYLSLAYAS